MDRGLMDVRRIREIGNWGHASEHIGRRWEELGLTLLPGRLAEAKLWEPYGYQPAQFLPILAIDDIQEELSRLGLPNPDVVLVGADHYSGTVLQALDFKWTIEFASYRQIRAEAVLGLLAENTPHLREGLAQIAGSLDGHCLWRDGVLFAPDSFENRRFLSSAENRRQEYPIDPSEVVFEPVGGASFFGPLPGWNFAERLAQLDRAQGVIKTLEGAEKYYRLGTGILGAINQMSASIFDEDSSPVEAEEAWQILRHAVRVPSTAAFVEYVGSRMAMRQQNLTRLQALTNSPYRFHDLVSDLAEKGIIVAERAEKGKMTPERWRWIEVHKQIIAEHRAHIVRTGKKLAEEGKSDGEILAALERDGRRLATRARTGAQRLIEASLGQSMTADGSERSR